MVLPVLKTAFEKVLRRVLKRCLAVGFEERKILRRGSKNGLSRRHLEGRNTPFQECDPLRVRPSPAKQETNQSDSQWMVAQVPVLLRCLRGVVSFDCGTFDCLHLSGARAGVTSQQVLNVGA